MAAYYNENEPYAAQWLRNLIAEGLIAPGDVDDRSIVEVTPSDLRGYKQAHFFAGIGGWSYALRLAGWPDERPVWTGSCPCQPFSLAGKQGGVSDERHLWPSWVHLIAERKPSIVFGEQVASAANWLRLVRSDLEALDYAVGATAIEAASAGAFHLRDRFWFVGYRHSEGWPLGIRVAGNDAAQISTAPRQAAEQTGHRHMADANKSVAREEWEQRSGQQRGPRSNSQTGDMANSDSERKFWRPEEERNSEGGSKREVGKENGERLRSLNIGTRSSELEWAVGADGKARPVKPGVRLLAHGVSNRVGKLRALGNSIDWRPATEFIKAFSEIGLTE